MKYRKIILYISVLIFIIPHVIQNVSASYNTEQHRAQELDNLIARFKKIDVLNYNDNDLQLCDSIYLLSKQVKDPFYYIVASSFYGVYYIVDEKYDIAWNYLSQSLSEYIHHKDNIDAKHNFAPICMLYNNLAIYYINYNLDFKLGMEYFISGIELARQKSLNREYAIIAYNMTILNLIRNDDSKFDFARNVYQQGQEWNDDYIEFIGSLSMAIMHYINGEYNDALHYIESILNSEHVKPRLTNVYTTYANILNGLQDYPAAKKAYETALKHGDNLSQTTLSYAQLSYGKFLLTQNQPSEAIKALEKALGYFDQRKQNIFLYQIYKNLSLAYEQIGNFEMSLKYHKEYYG